MAMENTPTNLHTPEPPLCRVFIASAVRHADSPARKFINLKAAFVKRATVAAARPFHKFPINARKYSSLSTAFIMLCLALIFKWFFFT
jgi:hypothetical protein